MNALIFLEAVFAIETMTVPASEKNAFFVKSRPIHFHTNSTKIIRMVK